MKNDCKVKEGFYENIKGDYYASQMKVKRVNGIWFRKRQLLTRKLVNELNLNNDAVLDVGCGNSLWSDFRFKVIGVDLCEAMLRYNSQNYPKFTAVKADICRGLPFKENSFKIVVVTEVFEHMQHYSLLIKEIDRVLKRNGTVIVSVPYSSLPGIWGLIFPLWCKFKFFVMRDPFYAHNCGHINGFSIKSFVASFRSFELLKSVNLLFLTIFFVFWKNR